MLYLTTPPAESRLPLYVRHHIGVMVGPHTRLLVKPSWPYWAVDTGCFAAPDAYDDDRYLDYLARAMPDESECLFATAPDVVGDWGATLERSWPMFDQIAALGYRPAVCLQEGVTPDSVPWDAIGCVFVGGGNDFKTSEEVVAVVAEAGRRGVWAHMGRVNTLGRMRAAATMGCDSADGTFLAFGPDANMPRLARWLGTVRTEQPLPYG